MDLMEPISGETPIPDARLSRVLDNMMPAKLFWRSGMKSSWVFWSQEASTNWAIQERIITALCSCSEYLPCYTLIQFWAAEMIGERCHLTTTLQPFFLDILTKEKFIEYRKTCLGFNLAVAGDVDVGNIMDGNLGRVFRNQLPEFSSNLSYNSVTEYPQRDLALSCGFRSNLAMPVLEPSQQCCFGVLELLSNSDFSYKGLCDHISTVNGMLKNARMETINAQQIRTQIQYAYKGYVEKEIKAALRKVRTKFELISACVWVRCARIRSVHHDAVYPLSYNDYCVNCEGELLFLIPDMSLFGDKNICHYRHASAAIPLIVGQGLVGKATLYRKPFLCRDVSQLSITQYPLVHSARGSGFKGCFAVCLRTNATGNHEYVVELFLPRNETYMGNHHNFLSSIITTMKHHLTTFEVVTQDTGNQLFIEVDKFSFNKEFESMKEFPTFNTQLEFEGFQNREGMESDHSIDHRLDVEDTDVSEQHEIAISSERVCPEMQSKAQNLEKKSSCSRKDLEQQFGKKLKDAAEILGVSRSTLKRWCREHKINRWPSYKRSKVCSSSSTSKKTNAVSRGNVGTTSQSSARDPLCSEPATNVALMPASSTITIKVPYGNVIIMFKLSYSSTMAELVENVIKRTRLAEGTFSIAYLDEEDDPILLACDEDFQNCIDNLRLSGKTTIRMQIEPISNESP